MKKSVKIVGVLAGVGLAVCGILGLVKKDKDEDDYVLDGEYETVDEQAEDDDEDTDE